MTPKTIENPHGLTLQLINETSGLLIDLLEDLMIQMDSEQEDYNEKGERMLSFTFFSQHDGTESAPEKEYKLESLIHTVRERAEGNTYREVRIRRKARDENTKYALVTDMTLTKIPASRIYTEFGEQQRTKKILTMTLTPWESANVITKTHTTIYNGPTQGRSAADDPNGTPGYLNPGSMNGRIQSVRVLREAGTYAEFWMGFKPKREGFDSWVPTLYLKNGTASSGTPDTTTNVASTASGSTIPMGSPVNNTTFATTPEMVPRFHGTLDQFVTPTLTIATSYSYAGRYRMLLRYRVTNTNTRIAAQVRTRPFTSVTVTQAPTTQVSYLPHSTTEFQIYDLGEVTIPINKQHRGTQYYPIQNTAFEFLAERLAGTGSMEWDVCFILPSEHGIHAKIGQNLSTTAQTDIRTDDTGETKIFITETTTGTITHIIDPDIYGKWEYPKNGGMMLWVAQESNMHTDTNKVSIVTNIAQRWIGRCMA